MWALGVTIYQLLTGRKDSPFNSQKDMDLGKVKDLPSFVPECLSTIVRKLLKQNPEERLTCEEALDILLPFLHGLTPKPIEEYIENESSLIKLRAQSEYLGELLPKAEYVKLIYRATRDGWSSKTFHELCDNKGKTLLIFKTSKNHVFAGYTSVPWSNGSLVSAFFSLTIGWGPKDNEAYLCSLTNDYRVFRPENPKQAVTSISEDVGPAFGFSAFGKYALSLGGEAMNQEDSGICRTNNVSNVGFNIPTDSDGNNVLTGDGAGKSDDEKRFTCTELEVLLVFP